MKTFIVSSGLVLGASLIATAALALPGARHFEKLDANSDGKITAAEMSAHHQEMIDAADFDGDGALTEEEIAAHREKKRAEWRENNNPDINGDGVIDRIEFLDAAEARFDRMDKNADGVLSDDEKPKRRGRFRRGD
ncbi:MAG: hypothetical protein AAFW81_11150 [Pseudomonadota bacterium]